MILATRCPACDMVFRVTAEQLVAFDGWVRCGQCGEAFDAAAARFEVGEAADTTRAAGTEASAPVAAAAGTAGRSAGAPPSALPSDAFPTAGTPAGTASADAASAGAASADAGSTAPPLRTGFASAAPIAGADPAPAVAPTAAPLDVPGFVRRAERQARRRSPRSRFSLGLGLGLLLAAAVLATLHRLRDDVAARWPVARPWLAALCGAAGCRVAPLRRLIDLTVESSTLDTAPGSGGRLRLTVVVRNRGALPVAAPWVALSFTGRDGRTLAQRSLAPADFAPTAPAELAPGRDATLTIDLPAVTPAASGYAVELFYP